MALNQKQKSPWAWIPTLYIAEGLPNVIVTAVAVVLYMQMGLTDGEIGLYTGWLGLPWIIKPLWSPFVDLVKTKRWWILLTQVLLGSSLAGIAFTLRTDFWFQGTMFCFFLMAFSSATHDIAADGFYMLELDGHQQAWFVGIRNTFYRLAVIFGNGVLVPIAGLLQKAYPGQEAFTWSLVFYGVAALFIAIWLYHTYIMPRPKSDVQRQTTAKEIAQGMKTMLTAFIHKMPWRQMLAAIVFILFYRFPEAMLNAMSKTFLTRPQADGGLGLSLEQYGISYGTVGLIGLLLGGIVGGICLYELCHAIEHAAREHLYLYRAVRLRTGLHRPHTLHALLLDGRVQDLALCYLYRHILSGSASAWHGVGLPERCAGLPAVLHRRDGAVLHHVPRHTIHQDRSRIR